MKERTILLVDADGDCEQIVSEAGIRTNRDTLLVRTSRDAFRILEDKMRGFDAVIVDVDPGAHGLALLEAISICADKPPMVVLTALEEAYMDPIAVEHGAAACLGKPITIQRLGSVLEEVSQHSRTCDRWGNLLPSTGYKKVDVARCFTGIGGKLSAHVSPCYRCR